MRALLLTLLLMSFATFTKAEELTARDGWIRPAPPVASVRAGYVVIENAGDTAVVLDKVESPDFGAIEIHTMFDDAGVMRMRRVPELHVPAKGRIELKPGGLHLMMFRPKHPLADGDRVEVVLSGPATRLVASLIVKPPSP